MLDSYLLWFHRVFFFSMIRIAVDFSLFFIASMLTVRWFFLAQFSNFRSLSRRKFAHILYTYTNFRRNKKKVRSRFYSQITLMLGIFLQSNVFQHSAMSIKENLKNDKEKNRRQPKKNYKKHFNSQTLAFIVDYLNSCNKHPFLS